jgi:hypothetical protein
MRETQAHGVILKNCAVLVDRARQEVRVWRFGCLVCFVAGIAAGLALRGAL